MNKTLIAIDNSPSAMKAVEYVARQFLIGTDQEIAVVHVLPNLPAIFWDEGHILSEDEKRDRKKVVDKWIADQKALMEPVFKRAVDVLSKNGISASQIMTKSLSDSTDVAASIIEEARDGGFRTVVVGRSRHSPKNALGTVAGRLANQGAGLVVTIVE
jgi:nucleotide-binding universal stress UspA family protein